MAMNGIDVSKHQAKIDWNAVRSSGKVDFAILRAGIGKYASQKDVYFETNYKGCKDNGIACGAYWYSYAMSEAEAVMEANACLQCIQGKQFAFPVYFDFEERKQLNLGKAKVSQIVKSFCDTITKAGYIAGIYSMKSGLEGFLTEDVRRTYTNWVAHVGVKQTSYTGYDMWQYSWKGAIPGIKGDVDLNICYRDFPAEIKSSGRNGFAGNPQPEASGKTIADLAREVLDGKWGNGSERRERLTAAGYNYTAVQSAVNELVNVGRLQLYTVQKGDTLGAIARKYGTTVDAIVEDNRLKYPAITANFIRVGWVLRV